MLLALLLMCLLIDMMVMSTSFCDGEIGTHINIDRIKTRDYVKKKKKMRDKRLDSALEKVR